MISFSKRIAKGRLSIRVYCKQTKQHFVFVVGCADQVVWLYKLIINIQSKVKYRTGRTLPLCGGRTQNVDLIVWQKFFVLFVSKRREKNIVNANLIVFGINRPFHLTNSCVHLLSTDKCLLETGTFVQEQSKCLKTSLFKM